MKKSDPFYFEAGDIVTDKRGNRYVFTENIGDFKFFVVIQHKYLFNGHLLILTNINICESGLTRTGEKTDVNFAISGYCCCDKKEV